MDSTSRARRAQFGVRIPVAGVLASPYAIRAAASEAEALGFDTVWVHDYLIWDKTLDRLHISCGSREAVEGAGDEYPPVFFESLTSLAFCAAVTSRIRLGVALLILPYREPLFTAKQIACIDQLSGGRLDLGIGQGAARSTLNRDFEVLGISRRDKVERTEEYWRAMVAIWSEASPDFDGRFVSFRDATIFPKPSQKPHPFAWLGGSAQKSLEMVAKYADGWLSCWVTAQQFPAAIARLSEMRGALGRTGPELVIGSEIQVMLRETDEQAKTDSESTLRAFEDGYAGTTGSFAAGGKSTDALEEIRQSSLIGSPASVRDRLYEFIDGGCEYFEMKFIYNDLEDLFRQWRLFADVVMPRFQ